MLTIARIHPLAVIIVFVAQESVFQTFHTLLDVLVCLHNQVSAIQIHITNVGSIFQSKDSSTHRFQSLKPQIAYLFNKSFCLSTSVSHLIFKEDFILATKEYSYQYFALKSSLNLYLYFSGNEA